MSNRPLVVGVTGGIGSGKSTICKIFETLGTSTYYADDRAKWLMENDPELVQEVKSIFGEESYRDGKLDRKFIGQKAFKDQNLLDRLNAVVHPAVRRDVAEWQAENSDARLLLKEAALLFETGSYKELDKNILVTAPEPVRIERVLKRDTHRSADDVKDIINKQMKDSKKETLADFMINNDGKMSVVKQTMEIYDKLVVA